MQLSVVEYVWVGQRKKIWIEGGELWILEGYLGPDTPELIDSYKTKKGRDSWN